MAPPLPPLPLVRVRRPGARGEALPRAFGKYTLLRKLATGGMAELYLALHRGVAGFEKLVVIKRILPAANADPGFIDLLLHEARVAATLSHPNIVQIFDVDQADGTYFIAMEHVHGEDLRSIVRKLKERGVTQFPLEHTLAIIMGQCAALAYAHERTSFDGSPLEIVHRDISPQNVVVTFSGDIKVVDFGIAKSTSQPGEDTKSGQLKGKVAYMSPEQALGEHVDWRTDIFATGVMLFELTTGRRLFKGSSEFETLKLICERQYPLPTQVRSGYPKRLEAIVMKALAKERTARYQSAREMQSELEAFVREERVNMSQVALAQWIKWLFEDQLAQQQQELQEAKQLADVIAHGELEAAADVPQEPVSEEEPFDLYSSYESGGSESSSGSTQRSAPAATRTLAPQYAPPEEESGSGWRWALVGIFFFAVAGGLAFVSHKWPGLLASPRGEVAARTADAHPAGAVDTAQGKINVVSDPPGATIWLDGNLRAETTPAVFERLPFGRPLPLKIAKDGFEPYKQEITLSSDHPEDTVIAALRRGSVTIQIHANAPQAAFWLDGKPIVGPVVQGITANEDHRLVSSAPGHAPKVLNFRAGPGEKRSFDFVLERGVARAAPSEPGAAAAPSDPATGAEGEPAAPKAPAPASDLPDKGAALENGQLSINAWGGSCAVTIDGASRGTTPVNNIALSTGYHNVVCKPDDGPAMTQTVKIESGQPARVGFIIQ